MKLLSRSQSSEATCRRQPPTQIAMPITMQMQMGMGMGMGMGMPKLGTGDCDWGCN